MRLTRQMVTEAEHLGELNVDEDKIQDFDRLEEDTPSMIDSLQGIYSKVKAIGDELTMLSQQTNDVEMKSVLVDLGSDAYTLALDIEDAADTYQELNDDTAVESDDIASDYDDLDTMEEVPGEEISDEELPESTLEEVPEENEELEVEV